MLILFDRLREISLLFSCAVKIEPVRNRLKRTESRKRPVRSSIPYTPERRPRLDQSLSRPRMEDLKPVLKFEFADSLAVED